MPASPLGMLDPNPSNGAFVTQLPADVPVADVVTKLLLAYAKGET